ncbi:MAG: Serine-protein kinase RsbW [Syntrophus sp. SKADARSKE-3]|nr:Serine-protein kinase RsbW [Syntrophus sp. SKADARSKE-3]
MEDSASSIKLPARMDSLMQSLAFVGSFTGKCGFDQKRSGEIELCLEEVLVNIINYAYPDSPGDFEIACRMTDNGTLIIDIIDQGIPFDVLSVDDPNTAATVDERRIGGLGIFFVKQLMDDVQYHRINDKNILTLSVYAQAAHKK